MSESGYIAVVTVEHAADHSERFTVPEAEWKDHSVGQPIIDAVDYVFDEKFDLPDSEREDFHFKTSVRFDSSEFAVDDVHPAVATTV